jgi:hypothetical protein
VEGTPETYGSTEVDDEKYEDLEDDGDDGDDFDEEGYHASEASFRQSKILHGSPVGLTNLMLSVRHPTMPRADDYEMVPTMLEENVSLVCDPNLLRREPGTFYYAEKSFYNKDYPPSYVITVNPDIFQQILDEVHNAETVPCGLYFCCQGGDAAHAGVSHEDYVDIRLAWTLVAVVFGVMLIISVIPG